MENLKGSRKKMWRFGCMDVSTSAIAKILCFFDILLSDWIDQAEILREGLTEFKQAYEGFSAKLVQSFRRTY